MENDTIKLLLLEGIDVDLDKSYVNNVNNVLECSIIINDHHPCCEMCGSINAIAHGYSIKKITHSISTNQPCIIKYKARRYLCKDCGKTFFEKNPFCQDNDKVSVYTELKALDKLRSHTSTFATVARDLNLSTNSVINIFDKYVMAPRLQFSEVICIDEIYTNKLTHKKYSCVIANFFTKQLIDVLPSRHKLDLLNYFGRLTNEECKNVKFVVCDMWESYKEAAHIAFPYAKVAVDSFHVIQHLNTAVDLIRLKVMRKYYKAHNKLEHADMYYYMLKKFHYFFTRNFDNIYDGLIEVRKMKTKWDKYTIRRYLLSIDDDLKYAFLLKENYQYFNYSAKYEDCDEELDDFINQFQTSHLGELREFGNLLKHWRAEIKNSFIRIDKRRLSNGVMENINSRLKCIIKNANGYRNFERFRKRCMFAINKDAPIINPK